MEPHWNNIRIEQVVGRARRLCSHSDLPKEDQNVTVYRYLSIFASDQTFVEPFTTDEFIFNLARNKEKICKKFLEVVKNCAVDCLINYHHNNTDKNIITPFTFATNETGEAFSIEELFNSKYKGISDSEYLKKYKNTDLSYVDYPEKIYDKNVILKVRNLDYLKEQITISTSILKLPNLVKGITISANVMYDKLVLENIRTLVPVAAIIDNSVITGNGVLLISSKNFSVVH
jgi:hypothetical protein